MVKILFLVFLTFSHNSGFFINLNGGLEIKRAYPASLVSFNFFSGNFIISARYLKSREVVEFYNLFGAIFGLLFCYLWGEPDCLGFKELEPQTLEEASVLLGYLKKFKKVGFSVSLGSGVTVLKLRNNTRYTSPYIYPSLVCESQLLFFPLSFLGFNLDFSLNLNKKGLYPFCFLGIQIGKFY